MTVSRFPGQGVRNNEQPAREASSADSAARVVSMQAYRREARRKIHTAWRAEVASGTGRLLRDYALLGVFFAACGALATWYAVPIDRVQSLVYLAGILAYVFGLAWLYRHLFCECFFSVHAIMGLIIGAWLILDVLQALALVILGVLAFTALWLFLGD